MNYFPALLNIEYKEVVIVGGGNVATQKVRSLLHSKAHIYVVSPQISNEIKQWCAKGLITWHEKTFQASDVDHAVLIFAATNDESVNDAVEEAAQHWQLLSRADAKGRVDFINPAVIRRGHLLLTVSTSGASPGYTRKLKKELETQFDDYYGEYIAFLKHCRTQILAHITNQGDKRIALQETLQPQVLEWIKEGQQEKCHDFLENLLSRERRL